MRESSEASASARRIAHDTLSVATATLVELEAQTNGLSGVVRELDECDASVRKVRASRQKPLSFLSEQNHQPSSTKKVESTRVTNFLVFT